MFKLYIFVVCTRHGYGYTVNALFFHDLAQQGTADITSSSSTSTCEAKCANNRMIEQPTSTTNLPMYSSPPRTVVYQSPRVPPRRSPPEVPPKPSYLPVLSNTESSPSEDTSSSTNTVCFTVDSPLPSPRSPSKIPTPLPRKSISNPTSPQSPPPRHKNSEIPVPTSPRSIRTPETDSRRLTVVEVCEKLMVPRGQAQITPFIVVERLANDEVDNAPSNTEVSETEHKLFF